MIDVMIDGRPAQIVPTRMHEPGLYFRFVGGETVRDDGEILKGYADRGLVVR